MQGASNAAYLCCASENAKGAEHIAETDMTGVHAAGGDAPICGATYLESPDQLAEIQQRPLARGGELRVTRREPS